MKRKIAALTVLLLLLFIPSLWLNARRGVYLGDRFFVQKDALTFRADRDDAVTLTKNSEGETAFDLLLGGEASAARLTWSASAARVEYEDGAVIEGLWNGQHLTEEDGMPLYFHGDVSISVNGESAPIGRYALSDALCRMDSGATESSGSIGLTLAGALIYLFGAIQFLWPEKTFFFCSRWMFVRPELSEDGCLVTRVGGAAILLCGAAVMLGPLFFK